MRTRHLRAGVETGGVVEVEIGTELVKRLRQEMKMRCKLIMKYKTTTDSNRKLSVALNLPNQDFAVPGPNGCGLQISPVPSR